MEHTEGVLHMRAVVPKELSEPALRILEGDDAVTALTILRGPN
ncbi:hypothetical protein [Nostocoides australiense]|nr:hypothetical protein [Tetrasphaera australiensis]